MYWSKDLLWRCCSEKLQPLFESNSTYHSVLESLPSNVFGVVQHRNTNLRKQQARIWAKVVHDYSHRQFTFPEDRFCALAGVISELQFVWGDIYLAGLWRTTFVQHLLWQRTDTAHVPAQRSLTYAPSWSWTAVEYGVRIIAIERPDAKLIDYNVEPDVPDLPFGQVKQGKIVLRAKSMDDAGMQKAAKNPRVFTLDQCDDSTKDRYLKDPSHWPRDARYILLGRKANDDHAGLILQPASRQEFRRVGYIYYSVADTWLKADWISTCII